MKIPRIHSLRGLFKEALSALAPESAALDLQPKSPSKATKLRAKVLPIAEPLDDGALFRESMGQVRFIAAKPEAPRADPPAPDARMSRADEAHVLIELQELPDNADLLALSALEGADRMQYLAQGYPPKILRKLRRGQFKVQDEIDLHHMPLAVAKAALTLFLHEAKQRRIACVLLVHGKGLRSGANGPVLKNMLDRDLRRRQDVIGFTSAPLGQGGTGALLLLLKS